MPEYESWTEYREVPGYHGYKVGNDGSVWSSRSGGWKRMKGFSDGRGYTRFSLAGRYIRGHRLVLEAFVGPCPDGMEGCHSDGDRTNNSLSNLRWDTRAANVADSVSHGTFQSGFRNGNSKLSLEMLDTIRLLAASKQMSFRSIGRHLGVCHHTVISALRGITYRKD